MKKSLTQTTSLVVLFAFLMAVTLNAQNWTQSDACATPSYLAGPSGKIVMKSTTGVFNQTGAAVALGTNNASRIPGTVEWNQAAAQAVQPRYYFNLSTTGAGQKNIADGVHVGGAYTPNADASGGDRNYAAASTFYYDGTINQAIAGEGATGGGLNAYKSLDLSGGTVGTPSNKTNTGAVEVNGILTTAQYSNLVNQNNFTINGAGASIANGNITVDAPNATVAAITFATTGTGTFALNSTLTVDGNATKTGTLSLSSTGTFTVSGGATPGTLLLSNSVNAKLAMLATSYLDVAGTFTNNRCERDNMTFATGSTVEYSSTTANQKIISTLAAAKYGNLITTGAVKQVDVGTCASPSNVVYVDTDLKVNGTSWIDLEPTLTYAVGSMTGNIVDVTAGTGNLTYASGDISANYIKGHVRRSGTIPTTGPITFNNAQTQITFSTAPVTSASAFVIPNTLPSAFANDVSATYDVARIIELAYVGGTPVITTLKAGYLESEATGLDLTRVRFAEGFDANQNKEKVLMAVAVPPAPAPVRANPVATTRTISLSGAGATLGFEGTHTIDFTKFTTGSALVFTTKGGIYSIADGRWSNPATWDEGVVPANTDSAVVRHLVYTGIQGAAYGNTGWPDPEINGLLAGDAGAAAYAITVIAATPTYTHPVLLLANQDTDNGQATTTSFRTRMAASAGFPTPGFLNLNCIANTENGDVSFTPSATNHINGIWVQSPFGATQRNTVLAFPQIVNAGTVQNNGTIEVGQ